jgi:hypothetical protein
MRRTALNSCSKLDGAGGGFEEPLVGNVFDTVEELEFSTETELQSRFTGKFHPHYTLRRNDPTLCLIKKDYHCGFKNHSQHLLLRLPLSTLHVSSSMSLPS